MISNPIITPNSAKLTRILPMIDAIKQMWKYWTKAKAIKISKECFL